MGSLISGIIYSDESTKDQKHRQYQQYQQYQKASTLAGLSPFTSSSGTRATRDVEARLIAYMHKSFMHQAHDIENINEIGYIDVTQEVGDEWMDGTVIGIWDPVTHDMWHASFSAKSVQRTRICAT